VKYSDLTRSLELSLVKTAQLSPDQKREIVDLCTGAFGEDFSSLFYYVDAADHVVAHLDGRIVGHALWGTRWLQPEKSILLRTAYVDAVATTPTLWGRGVGSAVMQRLADETVEYDAGALSTDRPAFYARLGWKRWLGPTGVRTEHEVVPTPEETVMFLRTPRTPPLDLTSLLTVEWREGQPW
jgi:aminoglycoside 2'-N-acetyltransferase I